MRYLAILALSAISAAAPAFATPLQPLTEADVGADALKNAACYVHDGPAVLLVATKRNAVVNDQGDLRLLRRLGGGAPSGGARYGGTGFEIVVSPAAGEAGDVEASGRSNQPARIRIVRGKSSQDIDARWSCGAAKGA